MKRSERCPKCGGTDILKDALTVDRDTHGRIAVGNLGQPDALVFKGLKTTPVHAWVCAKCGFVEFYAADPASIRVTGK